MGNFSINIEDYIPDYCNYVPDGKNNKDVAAPICREERQYALYLFNVLLGIKAGKFDGDTRIPGILTSCGLAGAEILNVFYEATFMRDIRCYNQDRKTQVIKSFNSMLLDYIQEQKKIKSKMTEEILKCQARFSNGKKTTLKFLSDINLGTVGEKRIKNLILDEGIKDIQDIKNILDEARTMMNSKPDLAVIYEKNEDGNRTGPFLKFIECKYISPESGKEIKQTDVQRGIADFLCKMKLLEKISIEPRESAAKLVRFLSNLNRKKDQNKDGEGKIEIATLIKLNEELFKKCPA